VSIYLIVLLLPFYFTCQYSYMHALKARPPEVQWRIISSACYCKFKCVCCLLLLFIHQQVRAFLEGLPANAVVADVGCGNGKYFGVRRDLAVLGSDRSEGGCGCWVLDCGLYCQVISGPAGVIKSIGGWHSKEALECVSMRALLGFGAWQVLWRVKSSGSAGQ
jgi:hypothetical protein